MSLQTRIEALAARIATEFKAVRTEIATATSSIITSSQVDAKIDTKFTALINAAPASLDTLGELATALQSEQSATASIVNTLATKANATAVTALSTSIGDPETNFVAIFTAALV